MAGQIRPPMPYYLRHNHTYHRGVYTVGRLGGWTVGWGDSGLDPYPEMA